ncbi:MAG: hypothetical protein DRP06_01065 [Candidatus Aenigmatarchaeota archaeon]|nr:MAG: hypothetical protein DRP06_01065 [Candidatus Aenigmarchaeota archaeon]
MIDNKVINGVLFDMDGVVIDSKEGVTLALTDALKKLGLPLREELKKNIFSVLIKKPLLISTRNTKT